MRTRFPVIAVLLLLPVAGCRPAADEPVAEVSPPPAAALAPLTANHTVDQALDMLAAELASALETELQGGGSGAIVRAEAITDRLLETRIPFEWISDERYFVDARVRQIQAEADRIVAQIGSGVPRDTVLAAVRGLAGQVDDLRRALRESGGRPPPSLEQLLEGDTLPQRIPG